MLNLEDAIAQFDIDNPELPGVITEAAFKSGGYPFEKPMKSKAYEQRLHALQVELVKLQKDMLASGKRLVVVFEGRDAAGKGGTIKRYAQYLNPRNTHIVALPKPSDREMRQWYFQRYAEQLPAEGETALFDRSWYNRAVVEPVMGFCTPAQTKAFLSDVPQFEQMIVDDGIILVKFWLNIGQAMQIVRFHARRHDPLKEWKLSPVDLRALGKWDEYGHARNEMLDKSDNLFAPWTVIRANDKKRARLAVMRHVLERMDYEGKELDDSTRPEPGLVMSAEEFLREGGANS
ncbi:MAG: polyphosphate kinase 2 [Hyphomicrobiaceae bacterium]|nr:polyphosphate kinase 2 [Hyphomicrobiaceae bacterium]MCC0022641.1 polyphosphate kinase 2 [Hyphomicrobiaceae bacterium]